MCEQTPPLPTIQAVALDTMPLRNSFAKDTYFVTVMFACVEIKKLAILSKSALISTGKSKIWANGRGFLKFPNKTET